MKEQIGIMRALLARMDPHMAGVAPVEPRPLASLVGDVCRAHASWATGRGVGIARPNGPPVHFEGDPTGLQIVLGNLMSNAIKAAGPGTEICVGWAKRTGGIGLWFKTVARRGGIRAEPVPDRQGRTALVAAPDTPAFGHGRGVGLAIVERVLATMGGELRFHKAPSGRVVAHVFLPHGVVGWP